jgi:hypothetical protein
MKFRGKFSRVFRIRWFVPRVCNGTGVFLRLAVGIRVIRPAKAIWDKGLFFLRSVCCTNHLEKNEVTPEGAVASNRDW